MLPGPEALALAPGFFVVGELTLPSLERVTRERALRMLEDVEHPVYPSDFDRAFHMNDGAASNMS